MAQRAHSQLFIIHNVSSQRLVPYSSLTGYSFGTPPADQYAPQVPPPPTTPGSAPLGFAPATTPTQDLSKAPAGQPDFPYSQYGKRSILQFSLSPLLLSSPLAPPIHFGGFIDAATAYLGARAREFSR